MKTKQNETQEPSITLVKVFRLALTKNSCWSPMALFSGPNNHALLLTTACYSNFI